MSGLFGGTPAEFARPFKLALFGGDRTLDWLASILVRYAPVSKGDARALLLACTPLGEERILGSGEEWIFAFDEAAIYLGLDPNSIALRPAITH